MEILRRMKKTPNNTKSQHKKLGEGYSENKEAVSEGLTFYLKYIGSTLVEEASDGESYGSGASAMAVQRIITIAKASGKNLRKICLTVSPRGIRIFDMTAQEVIEDITIFRISFCTADKNNDKVFAFMARTPVNETMECHAFFCAKRKLTEAVTLTVSKAFELAKWKESKGEDRLQSACIKSAEKVLQMNQTNQEKTQSPGSSPSSSNGSSPRSTNGEKRTSIPKLESPNSKSSRSDQSSLMEGSTESIEKKTWQKFDNDESNLEDDFSELALHRSQDSTASLRTSLVRDHHDQKVSRYFDTNISFEALSRSDSSKDLLML